MTQAEIWEIIINSLMQTPIEKTNHRFDCSYDGVIYCKTEGDANCLADFFESIGFDYIGTRQCDDEGDGFNWEIYID